MRISDWSSDVCSSDLPFGLIGSVRQDQQRGNPAEKRPGGVREGAFRHGPAPPDALLGPICYGNPPSDPITPLPERESHVGRYALCSFSHRLSAYRRRPHGSVHLAVPWPPWWHLPA